jgi:hypothetical protein
MAGFKDPPRGAWSRRSKLPSGAMLLAEWRRGATYDALAEKYGLSPKSGRNTVCQALKRHCLRQGLGWPLPDSREVYSRKRAATYHQATINSGGVRIVVGEHLARHRMGLKTFCRQHRLGHSHLYRIMTGERTRATPHYALHIYAICGEAAPDWLIQKALDQNIGAEPRMRGHQIGMAQAS